MPAARPGRTHHTHISFPPTIHPLACVRPGYWSLPVKAAAADLVRPGGSSGANRAELNLPAEPEGSWAVGAVAIRSPAPTEVKRPCRPTRRPTPRPYRQFRGAHGGAPVFSSRKARPTTSPPPTAAPRWPAPPACVCRRRATEFPGSAGASLHEWTEPTRRTGVRSIGFFGGLLHAMPNGRARLVVDRAALVMLTCRRCWLLTLTSPLHRGRYPVTSFYYT